MRRFVALTLILTACNRQSPSPELTLRIAAVGAMEPLGPQLQSSYSALIKGLVFPPLLDPDMDKGWRPRTVAQWARIAPQRYRLKLDASARFSDDSAARNEDLITSLAAFGLRGLESDGWVEVDLADHGIPDAVEPADDDIPIDSLLQEAVLFRRAAQHVLGSGPFSVVEQDASRIHLRRVKPIPGYVAEVELVTFPTWRDAFARALQEEVNVLIMPDLGQIELLEGIPRFRLVRGQGVHGVAAVFNARRLSRHERKALADSIRLNARQLHASNCELNVPSQPLGAAVPPGDPLELLVIESGPEVARAALALRRILGQRGGSLSVEQPILTARRLAKGLYDIAIAPIRGWPPRRAAYLWHSRSPSNFSGYSNRALDQALNMGNHAQAEQLLQLDPPAVFLCRPERTMAVDARVKNPRLGTYDMLESLPDWQVGP